MIQNSFAESRDRIGVGTLLDARQVSMNLEFSRAGKKHQQICRLCGYIVVIGLPLCVLVYYGWCACSCVVECLAANRLWQDKVGRSRQYES